MGLFLSWSFSYLHSHFIIIDYEKQYLHSHFDSFDYENYVQLLKALALFCVNLFLFLNTGQHAKKSITGTTATESITIPANAPAGKPSYYFG